MNTIAGYRATRDDRGVLTVYDVPIFLECTRGDFEADKDWIRKAVEKAQQAEADGYLPPLHIRHHEMGTEVRPAGFFRITRAGQSLFKGQSRLTIFADLILTDEWAQSDVLAQRLPYRSVEIYDKNEPEINSLALLDHEAPYLQLPMLMIQDVEEHPAGPQASVAFATFGNPWLATRQNSGSPLVACFSRGASRFLITEDSDEMTTTTKKATAPKSKAAPKAAPKTDRLNFADGEDSSEKKDDEGESMEADAGMDVGAIVKAIEDGSISVADMEAITAAIQSRIGGSEPEEEEPEAPAPAMVPGGESMSAKTNDVQRFAEQAAEIAALRLRLDQREAEDTRRKDVDAAFARFEGKAVGANFRAELEQFHAEHGPKPFKSYVDALAKKLGDLPASDGTAAQRFGVSNSKLPECVAKFQAQGAEAVRVAAAASLEFDQLSSVARMRSTREQYVESAVRRASIARN